MIFRWNADVQSTGGEDEEPDQRRCSSENLNRFWAFFCYTETCVSCRYVNSTKKGKVRIFSMPYENNFQR